jgi:hypothetical protein
MSSASIVYKDSACSSETSAAFQRVMRRSIPEDISLDYILVRNVYKANITMNTQRTLVSLPVCLGIKHPSGAYDQIFYYCQTDAGLLMWDTLSDERTGLSFTTAAGPRQRSHSRVRVPWDSQLYFTVSDSRLPFSSLPTIRRATVEVFDLASTRDELMRSLHGCLNRLARNHGKSCKMIPCHENLF